MAVTTVTSNYNVRRRKQSVSATTLLQDSPRHTKRVKVEKREVFTPPASPEAQDDTPGSQTCYADDFEDPVLIGILDYMRRTGVNAMCSREISEGLQSEGKIQLSGATPSTMVDASIKQHHKRCSSTNRPNIIQKVADPSFPRKTLYHLASVDPFGPTRSVLSPDASIRGSSPSAELAMILEHESEASESDMDEDRLETLSNDGQGPFAASLDTRRRMSLSPSPELEFSMTLDDIKRSMATPITSLPASPSREQVVKELRRQQINISLPPSPFITPRQTGDEEVDEASALKLPGSTHLFTNSPAVRTRDFIDEDFYDVEVQSPEAVSLDDLDCLLGF